VLDGQPIIGSTKGPRRSIKFAERELSGVVANRILSAGPFAPSNHASGFTTSKRRDASRKKRPG